MTPRLRANESPSPSPAPSPSGGGQKYELLVGWVKNILQRKKANIRAKISKNGKKVENFHFLQKIRDNSGTRIRKTKRILQEPKIHNNSYQKFLREDFFKGLI